MATTNDNTLQMNNTTDALFRQWCSFIFLAIVTNGGWVQTADTGQMNFATVLHPTLANAIMGNVIIRMADTLQATAPVFCKIEFGSGSAANTPQITLTFGTGSNGTGSLTGAMGVTFQVTPNTSTVAVGHSYASADTSRFQLLMFCRAVNELMCVSVERTKDSTGADTGTGLLITWASGTNGLSFTQYLIRAGGSQPPTEAGLSMVMANQTTSGFTSDIGVGFPIHFRGIAQQAGLGIIAVNSGDFIAEATLSFSVYGATRTYQLGAQNGLLMIPTGNGASASRSNVRVGIRYD